METTFSPKSIEITAKTFSCYRIIQRGKKSENDDKMGSVSQAE